MELLRRWAGSCGGNRKGGMAGIVASPRTEDMVRNDTHPYICERGGYPGRGVGAIGSDVVDLDFAEFSLLLTIYSIS